MRVFTGMTLLPTWWKVFEFRLLVAIVGILLLILLAQSLEFLHNLGVLP
jgi:hypothetical protein